MSHLTLLGIIYLDVGGWMKSHFCCFAPKMKMLAEDLEDLHSWKKVPSGTTNICALGKEDRCDIEHMEFPKIEYVPLRQFCLDQFCLKSITILSSGLTQDLGNWWPSRCFWISVPSNLSLHRP